MSTLKVSTISPLGTDATKTITVGASGDTFKLTDGITVSGAGANTPAFSVGLSGNQDISNNTTTKITWDSEVYDTDNAFASNKFTVPTGKGGKYLFEMVIEIEYGNGAGEYGELKLRVNGSDSKVVTRAVSGNASVAQSIVLVATVNLSASDYVEGFILHTKGATQAIQAGVNTYFSGHRLIGA